MASDTRWPHEAWMPCQSADQENTTAETYFLSSYPERTQPLLGVKTGRVPNTNTDSGPFYGYIYRYFFMQDEYEYYRIKIHRIRVRYETVNTW
jgi:hypothetical protein